MPITNYPQGVSSFGLPVLGGGPLSVTTTGNVYFANSVTGKDLKADQSGQGTTPTQPFATISFAISQCKASNGDVIYVMPGHVETVAAAGLTGNIAGISVIGLGSRNTRPQLKFTATSSLITLSAANQTWRNMVLQANVNNIVTGISVTGNFVTLDAIDVVEISAKQFIQFCLWTGTDGQLTNCIHHQATANASNALWIQLQGSHRILIANNIFMITTTNSASSSIIESDTTAPVDTQIINNVLTQLGGTSVIPLNCMTGHSGIAAYNNVTSTQGTIGTSIALASVYGIQTFCAHTVNKNGIIIPTADS